MIKLLDVGRDSIFVEKSCIVDYVKTYIIDSPYQHSLISVETIDHFLNDVGLVILVKLQKSAYSLKTKLSFFHKELVFLLKSIFSIEKVKICISIE